MAVTLRFTVEDIDTKIATYNVIRVYRADTLNGTYTVQGTITLVADTYYYSYDDATGNLNKWYKYSFYNSVGPVESAQSDPFRVAGTTRLRIRQGALNKYGAGLVFAAATGGDTDTILTLDYRVRASQFRADRGKGTWLRITTGTYAGVNCLVKSTSPTGGSFDVEVPVGAGLTAGDEVEWHWMTDPVVWDDAINRGVKRSHYVERVPVVGVAGQYECSLDSLPWLVDKAQVADLRYYPTGSSIDMSWAGSGRWWDIREDAGVFTLVISPSIDTSVTLYLECTRPMPELYTDSASLPLVANEDLMIALAYDEVLGYLSRPGSGTAEERDSRRKERALHIPELHRLLVTSRPKPRRGPARLVSPSSIESQFKSR